MQVEPIWICAKCGHEYPNDQAEWAPDKISMVVLYIVGALLILIGAGFSLFLIVGAGFEWIYLKGLVLGLLAGFGSIRIGMKCKRGTKTFCPDCGAGHGWPRECATGRELAQRFNK